MKQITVQAYGQLAYLGRVSTQPELVLQANGRPSVGGGVLPGIGNINAAPQACAETGLLGTTRVATPDGPVELQELVPGDLVLDGNNVAVAVKHILKTPMTKTAICIRAPYFGLDQDLVIGADHRVAITSDTAEYLFGAETVLVPAWAIKDGRKAQHWELAPKAQLYQIQLETAATLKVGKCALESMPKSGQTVGKVLSVEEARCFAAEHKSGYQN
ncbi:Hint domain-containing protein [uncultured Litoreibacter sp.]|uniref:Hint domain-containing protein n=1 Tax=uncultured Litoreibacter sp. TaxID=1392394 RepID=UPI00261E8B36|nr:Hint domain-containing protein [uncultured Litoreibacter sp.]